MVVANFRLAWVPFSAPVVCAAFFGIRGGLFWEIDCWFGKDGDVREAAFDTLWRRGDGVDFVMGNSFCGIGEVRLRRGFAMCIGCVESSRVLLVWWTCES